MEIEEKLEEVTIDKVCRTCLSTSDDLVVTLFDIDEEEKTNFIDMITICYGKIVPSLQSLPTRLCLECQELIRKSYDFRSRCIKSTAILIGSYEESKISIAENKETQTDEHEIIQFDNDENFEGIHLQEDELFETSEAVLIEHHLEPDIALDVKNDETVTENIEVSEEHLIEKESNESNMVTSEIQVEVDKNSHKCEKCNRTFSRATHLRRHMQSHDEVKQMKCPECDKRFSRIDHLNYHLASCHSTSKPYRCDVGECNKGFLKEDQLRKHKEAKHSTQPNTKEICNICNKSFTSKKYLRSHMKIHSNNDSNNVEKITTKKDPNFERPYLCSECGLRFVRNDYLVIHMRRHLGLKPYKCRFCDKGFPRATDLTVHERYHTNEKTHLCNLCGKGFQRAYNLLVHMRVHTGEKPYECNYCSKSFSQGNDLKAHIRRHTGERFKCDLCSEGFIQGYHLTHHKRVVHGLDIKSHIRRVEKFSTPISSENVQSDDQTSQSVLHLQESMKIESEELICNKDESLWSTEQQ